MSWHLAYPDRVWYVWVAIVVIGLLAALELRGRGSLGALLSPLMQRRLVIRPSVGATIVRLGLIGCALLASVVALMRPQGRGETIAGSTSADVIIVLDVSKSMLAEDTAPNRLARAKAEIREMARQMRGYRLGLVAFAGRAALLCPLTPDQAFFDLVVSGVDTRSVSRGGTRIGDAIRTALEGFPPGPGAKLLVLITDGEDHESGPLDAAAEAADQGVRIVAVGLGSDQGEGSEIMLTDPQTGAKTPLLHDGVPVKSKLDSDTLREMTAATDGVYVPVGTAALDLRSILDEHIKPMVTEESDAAVRTIPTERYPWAVMIAILALMGAAAVGAMRRI